jgi:N-acetylglucosamine kinase-like BadF-type ATPase
MYFVGIDAGQTHLELVILDKEGTCVFTGFGGPSHIQGEPMREVFQKSIDTALRDIPDHLLKDVCSIGAGITGIGIQGKREAVSLVLENRFSGVKYFLDNDASTSFWGATAGKDGAVILAGTGTIAYGKHKNKSLRLGGLGYLLGDEGGGSWIGLTAIRRVLKSTEGRDIPSSIGSRLSQFFSLPNVRQLTGLIYSLKTVPIERIAHISEIVAEEASSGDALAIEILKSAAKELSFLTNSLLLQLGVSNTDKYMVYRLGGVWSSGEILNQSYETIVRETFRNIQWKDPLGSSAVGAALMGKSLVEHS